MSRFSSNTSLHQLLVFAYVFVVREQRRAVGAGKCCFKNVQCTELNVRKQDMHDIMQVVHMMHSKRLLFVGCKIKMYVEFLIQWLQERHAIQTRVKTKEHAQSINVISYVNVRMVFKELCAKLVSANVLKLFLLILLTKSVAIIMKYFSWYFQ